MGRLEFTILSLILLVDLVGFTGRPELAGLIGLFVVVPILMGWFGYKMYEFVPKRGVKDVDSTEDV